MDEFKFKYLVIIQGNNHHFSIAEFTSLYATYFNSKLSITQIQNTLYMLETQEKLPNITHPLFTRITFIDTVFKFLYQAETFSQLLEKLELKVHLYSKSFAIEQQSFKTKSQKKSQKKSNIENSTLAYPIYKLLSHLHVDLNSPNHTFTYLFTPNSVFLCEKLFKNSKDYLKRMPKLRPISKPYTLKSDMARAGINLLQLQENETLLDPFCGIGGILLEGANMKLSTIANDINAQDIRHLKTNFKYFKFPLPQLFQEDAQTQFLEKNSVMGIISDIPYGKSSRKCGTKLYENFLKNATNILQKNRRMVIIYANFTHFKELALQYFEEVFEIEEYINKSMTRYILVLKNSK